MQMAGDSELAFLQQRLPAAFIKYAKRECTKKAVLQKQWRISEKREKSTFCCSMKITTEGAVRFRAYPPKCAARQFSGERLQTDQT